MWSHPQSHQLKVETIRYQTNIVLKLNCIRIWPPKSWTSMNLKWPCLIRERRRSSSSYGPDSVNLYHAHYWEVLFQPITEATRSLDSVPLYDKFLLSPSEIIALVPWSPSSKIPPGTSPSLARALSLSTPMASPPSLLGVKVAGHHQQRWSPAVCLYAFPTDW